ncbi:MAG: hypothetical protein AAF564_02140 [Bacteroidota bacterium]
MKTYFLPLCLALCFVLAGCNSSSTQESMAASEAAEIELTDEDVQVLESIDAAPLEEAAPVTEENYEEALEQLEAELEGDQ